MKTRDGEEIIGWGIDKTGKPYAHINDGYRYGGQSMWASNVYVDGPQMSMTIEEWMELDKINKEPVYYAF